MKRFTLPLLIAAALATVSVTADSANAAGRRLFVKSHATVIHPVRRVYRPRVVLSQPIYPVVVPTTNIWTGQPVVIQHGNHLHYVPTVQPYVTSTYFAW